MVTSRHTESGDVRSRVLTAAMRLFAAHGFDGTALQDVASAVGVSKPAVLHHFPSKEALRDAVLQSLLEHWKEALPRLLLAASGEGRFDTVFGELLRFFGADPDRARVVLREALDRPEETRKILRGAVRPWLELVAGFVKSGVGAGKHHPDVDAEAYVLIILQLVIAATASRDVLSAALPPERRSAYARELTRIAKASLFPPAPPRRRRTHSRR